MAVCTSMPLKGNGEQNGFKWAFASSVQLRFSLNMFTDGEDYCSYTAKAFPFSHFEWHVGVVNACSHRTGPCVYKP